VSQPHQITIEQALSRAKKAIKNGNAAIALQLYNAVLQHQPNHPVAKKGVRKIQKNFPQNRLVQGETPEPSQDKINALVNLFHSGQLTEVEQTCQKLLQTYPQSIIVINVLGAALQELGRLEQAVQAFDRAIQLDPDNAEAHSNRGVALQRQGRLEEAVQSIDKAIQLKPDSAEAHSLRGVALQELGQLEEAVVCYNKAIKLKPDYANAFCNRGAALKELGQLKEAVEGFDRAIRLKPDYTEAYSNRGAALQELGQLKEAVVSCDKAIQLKPDYAQAYSNRGVALQELGQLREAVLSCERAIQLNPDYAVAYSNRGVALKDLGQLNEAVQDFHKAIQLNPGYAQAYNNCGVALKDLGKPEEAVESIEKAIQLKPDYSEAYSNRADLYKNFGELKQARETYERAIQLKPGNAEAHHQLSSLKNYKRDDPQIELMETLISGSELNENDRVLLSFALAKAYDGLGEYDKSFGYYKAGNRLRDKQLNYDIGDDKRVISKIREIFSAESLAAEVALDGNEPIRTLFIVGMPRSGTSLVEQILASHTQVHGAGELDTMRKLVFPILSNLPDNYVRQQNSENVLNEIKTLREGYLNALAELNVSEKIITDKMPLNFRHIGLICAMFPEAPIIYMRRDPRDVALSIYSRYFSDGHYYATECGNIAHFIGASQRLMAHWKMVYPERILELEFEQLVAEPEIETQRLAQFCGLQWQPKCLDFHQRNDASYTYSRAQVREPLNTKGIGRWRRYADRFAPCIDALVANDVHLPDSVKRRSDGR